MYWHLALLASLSPPALESGILGIEGGGLRQVAVKALVGEVAVKALGDRARPPLETNYE